MLAIAPCGFADSYSRPGDDVIVPPSVSTEDARKKFGDIRVVKP